MKWHCYHLPPFGEDYAWELLSEVTQHTMRLLDTDIYEASALPALLADATEFLQRYHAALHAVKQLGYTDQVTRLLTTFVMPTPSHQGGTTEVFLWQASDSTVFVASPYALPHLQENAVEFRQVSDAAWRQMTAAEMQL